MGTGGEHEHREADRTENGERLACKVDDPEARVTEHGTGDELADHDRNEALLAEGEERPGEARKHENRQLREHREIMPRNSALVSIVAATRSYESWVGRQVRLVRSDVAYKHEQMALAPFPVSALDLLPVGAGVGGHVPGACERTHRARRRRPAHRELRDVA